MGSCRTCLDHPIQHVRKIGDKTEKLAERMLADWDGCADEEDETSDNTPVRVRFTVHGRAVERSAGMSVAQLSNSRVVREAAASVRAKVGVVKRTAANELMVGRQVSQWLTEKKVRDTHRLAITPYAIELCFLPTKYEVEARDLAATKTWCDRREDYTVLRSAQGRVTEKEEWLKSLPRVGSLIGSIIPGTKRFTAPPAM